MRTLFRGSQQEKNSKYKIQTSKKRQEQYLNEFCIKASKMITIVPETPDAEASSSSSSRRRSSRRSTMFSSIASDNLLRQSFAEKDTAAASRRMRELRERGSSYRVEDKVTQWFARNDNDKKGKKDKSADDMSLTLAAATPPPPTSGTKTSSRRGRRSSYMAPQDMCDIFLAKENAAAAAASPTPSTSKTPETAAPKRRKSRMLLEGANPVAARPAYFPSPLSLSPKRRPRPSLCLSPLSKGAPSVGTVNSGSGTDASTLNVRRNVGDIIKRLNSPASSWGGGSPAKTEARERNKEDEIATQRSESTQSSAGSIPPPNSFANFSTDSAKAMVKQLVALSQDKEVHDGDNSLPENSVRGISKLSGGEQSPRISSDNPILSSVFAFVEVRTNHENRSRCVQEHLCALGAKVSERLTKQVTHVIFKDGSLSTYNKAKRIGAHIVSVTWIEACKKEGKRVDEALFPTVSKDRYDSPGLFPKLRKAKSMQPKDDAEMAKQLELALKRKKRRIEKEQTRNRTGATSTTNDSPGVSVKKTRPVPLDYYNSPKMEALRLKKLREKKEYANNLMKMIDEMEQVDSDEVDFPAPAETSADGDSRHNSSLSSEDFNTPLAKRLVNKLRKQKRQHTRKNGALTDAEAASAASESEISMRVVETDENDISGVEGIQPAATKSMASTSSPVTKRTSSLESLQLKRRLIITDDDDDDNKSSSSNQKPEEKTPKETPSLEEVPIKNPRRVPKCKKPSNNVKLRRNHPLFSQNPTELLSETPADDSNSRIPVSTVNVHADKAKDKAKQKTQKKVFEKPPQIEKIKEAVGSSQPTTQRRKIVPPRRSTLEFVDEKKRTKNKKRNNKKSSKDAATFICTSCRKEDVDLMKQLASRFGSLKPATAVTPSTSHVICGESRRTMSVLQGILRGCWVVSVEWVFASLEEGRWVDEEAFERTDFSAAVRECRLSRQAFGPGLYRSRLLEDVGAIYVDRRGCKAPVDQVRRLCELAGGATVKLARLADVVIGGGEEGSDVAEGAAAVSDRWLFDSIQHNKTLEMDEYLLTPRNKPTPD